MTEVSRYFIGQGKVYVAEWLNGNPATAFTWLGNINALSVSYNTETIQHQESYSGFRNRDLIIDGNKTASATLTCESYDRDTLSLALYGRSASTTAATNVADEEVMLYPRKTAFLKYGNLTAAPSITTTPALVAGTDYIVDRKDGSIFVPAGSAVPAGGILATVDYSYGASDLIGAFNRASGFHILRFSGLNTAESLAPCNVTIFKAKIMPTNALPLINNEVGAMELMTELMIDSTKDADSVEGQLMGVQMTAMAA